MKRSSVEQWIENVGESGCLEPAFKQNTNDDEINKNKPLDFQMIYDDKIITINSNQTNIFKVQH